MGPVDTAHVISLLEDILSTLRITSFLIGIAAGSLLMQVFHGMRR